MGAALRGVTHGGMHMPGSYPALPCRFDVQAHGPVQASHSPSAKAEQSAINPGSTRRA